MNIWNGLSNKGEAMQWYERIYAN